MYNADGKLHTGSRIRSEGEMQDCRGEMQTEGQTDEILPESPNRSAQVGHMAIKRMLMPRRIATYRTSDHEVELVTECERKKKG